VKTFTDISSDEENRIDFVSVFTRLNNGLSQIGQSLELTCAGGYVSKIRQTNKST